MRHLLFLSHLDLHLISMSYVKYSPYNFHHFKPDLSVLCKVNTYHKALNKSVELDFVEVLLLTQLYEVLSSLRHLVTVYLNHKVTKVSNHLDLSLDLLTFDTLIVVLADFII